MATTRKNTNKSETIAERFARIKQGVRNLDDETQDTQQQISFRDYLRAKEQGYTPETSRVQQTINPDMTAESMADYARYNNTKGAQLTNYDLLSDDLKNRLTEMTDLEDSDSSGLIRKTDDGSGLFGYKLEPGWKVNDIKDELRNDFHLDDETIKDLAEVNRSAKNRDEINAIRGDNTFEDQLQQYAEDNYVRTYPEEIEYATSKFSDATDDVDSLRRDINSYNSTASQKAEDYFTRPTLIQSIKSLASGENSNDLKQQIMEKYNLTDEQFEDLAYYGKELDNYDARAEQQEQAEKNVSHDNTKDSVIGGTINSLASQVTYLPGALSGVAETGKYYAGRLTGTSYDKHSPIDPNSAGFAATNASDDLQNATQQSISNWNHAAGLVYSAAMSTAKSAQTSMFAPGGANIGANIASKYGLSNAGTKLAIKVGSEVAGLAPFGAAAFSSALSDNVTSGKSMSDSLSDAARSASIEVITEIASLDKVYDIAKGNSRLARNIIADFAASTLIEGLEEMTGDALELITDNLKYGGDSDFNQSVKNYMGKGHTEEEATSLAWDDWKAQLIEDGIAGALSGAMGGAGATAIGVHSATQSANEWFGNYTKDSYKHFAEGVNTDANTYVNKSAANSAKKVQELANKYATQDTVSNKERRELYYAYNDAIDTENEARIEAAEKAEDQARKAVQQHKEWRAHESAVDEYNKSRGVETSEDTTEQSIAEAIPQELRAKENDSTAGDVHKEMAQSKTLDALDNAIQKGLNSTNENTRKQTLSNLDNLTSMLEAKGVATESDIQALKQTDAQIYQAGYTGQEIATATTRQKQIYNAGQQAAIEARSATNLEQREQMTKNAGSILQAGEKDLYTKGFQNGMVASSYDRIIKTISEAGRTGMSIDEALDKVQADMAVVGGDQTQLRSTIDSVYAYSQEQSLKDARTEMARAATEQANIKRFGTGAYIDNRTDKTVNIGGTDVLRAIAQATGLDVMVVDNNTTIGGSQGGFDSENGIIYLNAGKASRIASTSFHETGEFASVFAAEEFQGFVKAANNLLLSKLGSAKYNEIREDYLQRYSGQEGKTDADLDKEIACDLMYQILGSKKGMTNLLDAIDANNDAKQAKSIKEKLVDWIKNMAQSIKDLFADFDPSSSQRKMADAKIAEMDDVVNLLNQSIAKAASNYQQAKENGNVVSETTSNQSTETRNSLSEKEIEDGKASFDHYGDMDGGTMRFSEATYEHGGREFLEDYLNRAEDLTDKQKKDIIDRLDWAYKLVKDLSKSQYKYYAGWASTELTKDPASGRPLIEMNAPGNKPIKSVAVNNGEYQLNIDFSQICKKRATLNAVINSLVEDYELNLPTLTESDVNTINQTIKERGYEIACGLCFVDAKRYRVGKWAESFTGEYDVRPKRAKSGYNDLVQLLRPVDRKSNTGFAYFNFATKIPNTTSSERTMDELSNEEIDRSKLAEKLGKFAKRDESGNIIGIGSYEQSDGKRRNPTELVKMAWEIYNNPKMRKMLSKDDLISSDGLDAMREQNQPLYALVNAHWGAGKPKLPHGATAYGNEILRSSTWGSKNNFDPETAKMVGGVRVQSFSDYEANMFFDYCQMFADMAARKLTSHAYTKESDYVRLFGMTGQKINMSIVAKAANLTDEQKARYKKYKSQENMLKKDAELAKVFETSGFDTDSINKWAAKNGMSGRPIREIANAMSDAGVSIKEILLREDETFDIDEALALQKDPRYADNCGIIWIGISDEQIRFMLDSDDVPMIIPYHSSGVSAFIKKERNLLLYKDYQPYQTTKGKDGKALAPSKEFDFYASLYGVKDKNGNVIKEGTNDPKATADEYKAWCKANGYTPKFSDFKDHQNYYKLLIDFKVYDYNGVDPARVAARKYLPQNEIQMAFPEETNQIVVDSLKRQQATMDKLNSDFANQNDGILTELSDKLGLKDGSRMRMSYEEASDPDLAARIQRAYQGTHHPKASYNFGNRTIPNEVADAVSDLVGFSVRGYKTAVSGDSLRHILLEHGPNNAEIDESDHSMEFSDVERLEWALDHADTVWHLKHRDGHWNDYDNTPSQKIALRAKTPNGYYYIIEAVPDTKARSVQIVTAYIEEKDKSPEGADAVRLLPHVRNALQRDLSENSLAPGARIRNSLSENSDGIGLSKGQQAYFADSKAIDEDGHLMVMYHGTNRAGFTVFNSSLSSDYVSFFFTDKIDVAQDYSGTDKIYAPSVTDDSTRDLDASNNRYDPYDGYKANYKVYLNMRNPLVVDGKGSAWNTLTRFNERNAAAAKELTKVLGDATDGHVKLEYIVYGLYSGSLNDVIQNAIEEYNIDQEYIDQIDAIDGLDDLNETIEYAMDGGEIDTSNPYYLFSGYEYLTTNDYATLAHDEGYDGVIFKDVYDGGSDPSTIMVVFDPNQIKSVNNQNPTEDIDIRKSMALDDNRNMNNEEISENRDEVAGILEKGAEALKGTKINRDAVRNIAMEMKREYGSAYDLDQLTDNLTKLFGYLHSGKSINYNDFVAVMQDVARPVVDAAYTSQASREDYAQFRNGINELSFSLTPEQTKAIKSAFGSMKAFERYYPEIHITEDGKSFAEQWSSLVDLSRGLLDENTDAVDMPTALVDAMEALRPSMNNWEDNTQAAHDMALDIIGKYLANYHDDGANKAVINEFVKSAEKEIKASQKEWKSKIKEDYKERLKAERAYQKEIASGRVKRANERSAEQIAKLRAKNATRIGDIRERQKRNHQLQQINKSAKKLYDALVNPTDANHVPKDVQEPVLELMASLDMSQPSIRQSEDGKWHVKILTERVQNESGRYSYVWQDIVADTREDALRQYNEALANGLGSQGARKWFERMQKISDLYTKQDKGKGLDDQLSQDMNEFLQGLSEELAEDFDRIIKKGRESGKASLADLNSDDLKVINKVLKNVQNAINKINKSLTNPSVEISQLANGTIHHSEVSKGRVNHKKMKFINSIGDFLMLDNATMETYLHSIGADGLTQTLLQGQDTKARLIREAQEYAVSVLSGIDQNTIKSWENDVIDYGGIKLTKAQVMSLYELMKREDATSHRAGGFKADADDVNTSYLTDEKLGEIIGTLTDEERRTADKLQQFLANNCAEWGNRTSNILVGYDKFGNPHYFPMKVDKASVNANVGELLGGLTNSIRNMGMTKAVQENATNALILDSIFDVYAQHVSDMATYSAWAAPVQDLIRFYNYKEVVEEDGFIKRTTTKDAIKKLMGKNGTTYFTKMVSSIQQREQSAFVGGNIVEFLTGSAKKAAVMGNIRVVVQQPTAIFRAGKMIDYKYLNAGMVGENENLRKEMIGTSDVYWLKNQGNIDGYITQSLKSQITGISSFSDKVSNWTGKLASKADQITWDAMYRAVIAEQIDKLGKDKIGTQEFQDAVNKRFENIMLRTQVYDGTITRSQFMRSPDWLNKMQSAFMAEPVKTYNIVLRDAIDLLQADSKDGKVKAMRELGRSAVVLLITNAVNAAVQSVWDAVRNAGDPDEDDNDFLTRMLAAFGIDLNVESTDEQIQAFLGGNFIDNVNMFNNIPIIADYADDAFTTIGELVSGKSSYSYSNSDLSMSGWEHLGDALKAIVMPGEKQTAYGTFTKVARAFSDLSGYPVYAIQRDLAGVYNVVAHDIAPMLGISMPVLQKQTKNTKKRQAKLDVYDTIWNSTDLDEVKAAVEDAVTQGNSYKTINDDMSENLKEDYINLYNENQSEATKMANRLAEIKAYLSDQEGTLDGKTHSEKVEYYRKNIKKWLE